MKGDKERRKTRSHRLRKYGKVYKEYTISNEKTAKLCNSNDSAPIKKQSLNRYQKFVQEESKKEKYSSMSAQERLSKIAHVWKKKERKERKK